MKKEPDPKDYLANERTFLAWIRTGIGIIAFGFLIERASFLFDIALPNSKSLLPHQSFDLPFGIFLVILGGLLAFLSLINFKMVNKQIDSQNYRPSMLLSIFLTFIVLLIAVFLIIYL